MTTITIAKGIATTVTGAATATSPYAPKRRNPFFPSRSVGRLIRNPIFCGSKNVDSGVIATLSTLGGILFWIAVRYYWQRNHPRFIWLRRMCATLISKRAELLNVLPKQIQETMQSLRDGDPNVILRHRLGRTYVTRYERNGRKYRVPMDDPSHSSRSQDQHSHDEHQRNIGKVLMYWFGQYPPEESQKKLWMIAEQSATLRGLVDAEIANQFGSLLSGLAEDITCEELKHPWYHDLYGYQGKLAAIIVLDQFSRHIHRYRTSTSVDGLPSLCPQSDLDRLALRAAERLVEQHADEIRTGMVPVPMYIFALMPFRHASRLETVKFVQRQVETSDQVIQQYHAMLRRFRKATNRRLAVLQDQARSGSGNENRPCDYNDDEILECFPFEADLELAQRHPAHQTIRKFLVEHKLCRPHGEPTPVIVSLSGGVDSMVIASVLSHLNKSCRYNMRLLAVHIDYANRPESLAESKYVHRYCDSLGITFRCRRIDEVTRGVTARDEYEKVSREIRYDAYRDATSEFRREFPNTMVGVMLGHHRGDLRENVLSNAHKGCGPLDLSGMTEVSQNDGVLLWRPLLPLEKSDIVDYAHTFGVPYFKDTTPLWSTRGKLRSKLLPLLEEIYGEGSMNNLSSLAVESDACRAFLYEVAIQPFLNQIVYKPMGFHFDTVPWKEQSFFFWRFVLREALHSAGLGMFSDKSVRAFLERVHVDPIKEGWLQCRKDYAVYLNRHGRVFVLHPSSFPWRKGDSYNLVGLSVAVNDHITVGPWRVSVEECPGEVDCLEVKAISSMENLMEGQFHYYLEVPYDSANGQQTRKSTRPLVFQKFTKLTRPRSLKSVDGKLQEALPIVGNDSEASHVLSEVKLKGDKSMITLVKVTLRLE